MNPEQLQGECVEVLQRLVRFNTVNPPGNERPAIEYLADYVKQAGFEPLGFVVGSSIYHVGLQIGRWNKNQELQVLTQAMYHARELALTRMQAEAAQAKASGIVGVTVDVKNHVWGAHATEFLATGTAVRRLTDEHRLPETSPKPTFTLGLDN